MIKTVHSIWGIGSMYCAGGMYLFFSYIFAGTLPVWCYCRNIILRSMCSARVGTCFPISYYIDEDFSEKYWFFQRSPILIKISQLRYGDTIPSADEGIFWSFLVNKNISIFYRKISRIFSRVSREWRHAWLLGAGGGDFGVSILSVEGGVATRRLDPCTLSKWPSCESIFSISFAMDFGDVT